MFFFPVGVDGGLKVLAHVIKEIKKSVATISRYCHEHT